MVPFYKVPVVCAPRQFPRYVLGLEVLCPLHRESGALRPRRKSPTALIPKQLAGSALVPLYSRPNPNYVIFVYRCRSNDVQYV